MRYSASVLGAVALCVSDVVAFPYAAMEFAAKAQRDPSAAQTIEEAVAQHANKRTVGFNAAQQYVSNQGAHAFVPPTNVNTPGGDQRGPCPGLNAMANHGYLPHNGVATIDEFINGTYEVFGMGTDLGGFLAVYGAVFDGDLTQWSIGGPVNSMPGLLGLAQPQGISGSHNNYEADVSPSRPDLYEYGNDYKFVMSQFQQMFNLQPDAATANYDLSVLTPFRAARFQQSIENNPNFFNGPFTGVGVQPAAYTFIYRFMANKSAEYPEGILNQEVLKSFFSVTGESGNFKWTEGYEKIPDNWYKRAIGDEYTIPFFNSDLVAAALEYPQFLDIGGNTGTTNSFTGVDIADLTGGVFNAATLTQGNNLACFLFQFVTQAAPDMLVGLVEDITGAVSLLANAISPTLAGLNCPQLEYIQANEFTKYPGATGVENLKTKMLKI